MSDPVAAIITFCSGGVVFLLIAVTAIFFWKDNQ